VVSSRWLKTISRSVDAHLGLQVVRVSNAFVGVAFG
jgi:hypothetical protein